MKAKRIICLFLTIMLAVSSFSVISFADANVINEEAAKKLYVEDATVTSLSLKDVRFDWEKNEQADGYRIYLSTGSWSSVVGEIMECIDIPDNNITTYELDLKEFLRKVHNGSDEWTGTKCYIVPYVKVGDSIVDGTYMYSMEAELLDLNREDYTTDNTTPIIYDVEVPTQKTSIPGTVRAKIHADGTGSPLGTLEIRGEQIPPENWNDSIRWEPEQAYWIEYSDFGYKKTINGTVDIILDRQNDTELTNAGYQFETKGIYLKDAAGNEISFNMNFKEHGLVTVAEEFDFYFEGVLSNPNVPTAIEVMDEGQAVALTLNEKSKGIVSEELLRAIAGKDKTIVVYVDDKRSLQWVFYGKDIKEPIKDLDLNVKMSAVPGENYGTKGKIIKLDFANNGKLPGDVHFRLKSGYIKSIYGLSDNLYMYYQGANNLVTHEASDCEVVRKGNDYWCYLYLDHNSTFLLSGTKLANSVKGKTIVLSPSSYTYNGKYKAPAVRVKNGSVTLKNGTDYTYTVKKGKNIGKYAVTIKGKGKYTGTETAYYTINPKGTSLKSVKKGKKQFTAKWSKQSAKMPKARITGYQIRYSTKSSMASAKSKTVKGYSKTSLTVKKLSSKKTYYVQVRTYTKVGKTTHYSAWSKVKKVKTK